MATPTTSSTLKRLEEQLSCTVCNDFYTDPKTLPCQHSFCQKCLEGLPVDSEGGTSFIACPTCSERTELPKPSGVADFPAAVHLLPKEIKSASIIEPCGVTITDDGLIVMTELKSNRVMILDKEGKEIKSFGGEEESVKFNRPRGVAVTPDNFILVSEDHKIQKIDMEGQPIASVGEYGYGELQFESPASVAVSPTTGDIYVVDQENYRVQVLKPDLSFSFKIGGRMGMNEGQFDEPWGIAFDSQGIVYIVDEGNHRIQKLTPDGKFIAEFSEKGREPGELFYPVGIAIDSAGLVYVTENSNHRLSVFTSDGRFVRCFGKEGNHLKKPGGMAIDKNGVLYVCDYGNSRLLVL